MSNENHNNSHDWKSKLDKLDSLPDPVLPDKNAAWEKLHARLEKKESSIKPLWYWIAAACIILILIIPGMISTRKNNDTVKKNTKQPHNVLPSLAETEHSQKQPAIVIHSPLPVENADAITGTYQKINNTAIVKNETTNFRVYDTVSTQTSEIINTTDNFLLPGADTSSGLAANTSQKKKLPVVHINEIGDTSPLSLQVARNSERPPFHFLQLANQETYNSPPGISSKNIVVINLKTSSN